LPCQMNRWIYILGVVLIAGFAGLGMLEVIKAQTPRVTLVSEAGPIRDRPIWFSGSIVHEKTRYDDSSDELVFQLRDSRGDTIGVRYKGLKPAGFDRAGRATVRGRCYGSEIVADQIVLEPSPEPGGE
jgi:cytochrome c-type biogenesis protein CcmE